MADFVGGGDVVASPLAVPRPAPAPTGSPSGIKGPRMIMRERAEREARQRAEAERRLADQTRAEEAQLIEEDRVRSQERRSTDVAGGEATTVPRQQTGSQQASQLEPKLMQPVRQSTTKTIPRPSAAEPISQRHQEADPRQQTPSQAYLSRGTVPQKQAEDNRPPETSVPSTEPSKPRNSFPHAFERWETLSAHWEGLTSYWIRKLEQNKDDISRDALSQQLARQVTDLSAAGANLFHAVVELQRLRASSERKFQRWFFETRAELERSQEVKALLEAALEKERRERSDAIRDAVNHERGISKTQKQLMEMRKELAISKEEARRAWEELGRKAQEERDRTLSLQAGNPTIVGGVQVVPMQAGGASHSHVDGRSQSHQQPQYPRSASVEQSHTPPGQRSPPTPDTQRGPNQQVQASQASSSRHAASRAEYIEGEYVRDAEGNFILDVHGHMIPYIAPPSTYSGSEAEQEEYETPATTNPPSGNRDPSSTSSGAAGQWSGAQSSPEADYSGAGYGAPSWDTVPRHHHPTRLSDVIEEDDERSRTSASQVSRAGRD